MYMSFYTGAIGAHNSLERLSVVSHNLANVNNFGFKPKSAVFTELINYNLNASPETVTELQAGAGMRIVRTNTDFSTSSLTRTDDIYHYAITQDNAFFMLRDLETGEITYTRNGQFHQGELGGAFYLAAENGKLVLDANQQPIRLDGVDEAAAPGVYTFNHASRLVSQGDNEFAPADGTMNPILVENPAMMRGFLESSGTDMAKELVSMIESQRAFSYATRVVTTSDDIVQTINSLR